MTLFLAALICALSPLLFNLYSESIFRDALEDQEVGIKVNGEWINNIRYADDTVLLADSMADLQKLLDMINERGRAMGLEINTKKTKFMIVSRNPQNHRDAVLTCNDRPLQRVDKFRYLGTWLCDSWESDVEIRSRIEQARDSFQKYRRVLVNSEFDLDLRLCFIRCYVWSILLYGVEGWTLKVHTMNKLEAFEMWLYRRVLKIPWTAKKTNEEVLARVKRNRELLTTVKRRKTAYFGHVMRSDKYKFLQLLIEGKVEGKRGIGRKKMSWLRNIRQWTGLKDIGELVHTAQDRIRMSAIIANIL